MGFHFLESFFDNTGFDPRKATSINNSKGTSILRFQHKGVFDKRIFLPVIGYTRMSTAIIRRSATGPDCHETGDRRSSGGGSGAGVCSWALPNHLILIRRHPQRCS